MRFLRESRYEIVWRFFLINMLVFTLLRSVLYFQAWQQMESPISHLPVIYLTGFLYDLVFNLYFAIFFALFLLILPNRIHKSQFYKWTTYVGYFGFLFGLYFVVVAEWLFWDEFSVRFNFISVDYLVYRYEVTQNIYESYPIPWIMTAITILAAVNFYFERQLLDNILQRHEPFKKRLQITVAILAMAGVSFYAIGQPIRDTFKNNYEKEVASSGPYQFFAAFRNNTLDYKTFYAQADDKLLSSILMKELAKKQDTDKIYDVSRYHYSRKKEQHYNVVLISVESLSAKYLAHFGNEKNLTPFLDNIADAGLFFTNLYATGTRTTRGLEALSLSVPPTPGRSIVKRLDNQNFYSLGNTFRTHGYDTAFLYGGHGYFDNMNSFFSSNGYRIVDQTSIDSVDVGFTNAWGMSDEDLYRQAVKQADLAEKKKQPFFFHIMTTSNHRPFTYPEGRVDIPSGSGRKGAVKYTDYALRAFIEQAKTHAWFDNTIFVITADHCSGSSGRVGLPLYRYHIPLIVYAPKIIKANKIDKLASQIDIGPTLLALLDFDYENHGWGDDILSPEFHQRALIGNYQKLGLYEDGKLAILSPGKKIELIEHPEHDDEIHDIDASDPMALHLMSYYQSANYVLEHRMNRIHSAENDKQLK